MGRFEDLAMDAVNHVVGDIQAAHSMAKAELNAAHTLMFADAALEGDN